MNLREIKKIFPQYRIFKSLIHPKRYYAILENDFDKMEIIRKEFSKKDLIPDSYTVKALPLSTADNDFYNVFDHHPTFHRINDLIEVIFTPEDIKFL